MEAAMNYNEYQAIRQENIQMFFGDNPKFKSILLLSEEELKSTMTTVVESYQNRSAYQNFTRREMLQIIGFCAAELARIS